MYDVLEVFVCCTQLLHNLDLFKLYLFADRLDLLLGFEWVVGSVLESVCYDFLGLAGDEGGPVGENGLVGLVVHYKNIDSMIFIWISRALIQFDKFSFLT